MINYIKMDLFRLFKSTSFQICTLILIFMIGTFIVELRDIEKNGLNGYEENSGFSVESSEEETSEDSEDADEEENMMMGLTFDSVALSKNVTLSECMKTFYGGGVITFFVLLIMSIFVCNEFSNGFIKNTITIPKHRWYLNLSKLVVAFVVILIENVIAILSFVIAICFILKNAEIGDISPLLGYMGLETLLLLGIFAVVLCICNLTKSMTASITCSIMLAMQMIAGILSVIIVKIFPKSYDHIHKFLMTLAVRIISPEMGRTAVLETLALAIAGIVGYTLLSSFIISKKDVV